MRVAQIVVLGIALAAGGAAAMLASGSRSKTVVVQPESIQVLVAKADLGRAKVIGEKDIGWQTWPIDTANPTLIKKTEQPDAIHKFLGAMVRVPIASGEPIHEAAVVFAKNGGFMAAVVKTGMRAVSLDVSPDSAAGGSILPGDRVDVLLTLAQKAPDQGLSQTILWNVQVLGVSQKSVTIELTPRQAEILATSRQAGTISLTLRSFADSESEQADDRELASSINVVRYGVHKWESTQ